MRPRVGMKKSRSCRCPRDSIWMSSPRRMPTISMILPANSEGTSTESRSMGSFFTPSISLQMTCGLATANSYPSRRIVSMRIARCRTPRPETLKASPLTSSTRSATSRSTSLKRRSRSWRLPTYFPSRPKNGESLMRKSIEIVGSSMAIAGIASGCSASQMVSEMSMSEMPTIAQRSPHSTTLVSFRPIPSKVKSCLTCAGSCRPSRLMMVSGLRVSRGPLPMRPTKFE